MPSQPNAISLVPFGGSSGRDCCSALEHRATAPEAHRGWGPIPNLLRWGGGGAPDEQMLVPRSEAAPRGSGVRHKSCKDLCRTALGPFRSRGRELARSRRVGSAGKATQVLLGDRPRARRSRASLHRDELAPERLVGKLAVRRLAQIAIVPPDRLLRLALGKPATPEGCA